MKIGLLTFEKYDGRKRNTIGSTRIRARWLMKYWPEAEEFVQGQQYDIIIYQKAYFVKHAKLFKGFKILDLCDPDFLHWGYQTKEMIEEVDLVTTSTESLADSIRCFSGDVPVVCVPDRMDLDFFQKVKKHEGETKIIAWYGYAKPNFKLLDTAIVAIKKLNLELIVISDKGYVLPSGLTDSIKLTNYPWTVETVNNDLLLADVVVNPRSKKGRWKFKSNNKTVYAWALGLPVAHDVNELENFMSEESRAKESELRLKEVKEKWDIKISVQEYKDLIYQHGQIKS